MTVHPPQGAATESQSLNAEGASDVFVARQPILDQHKRLFAYELLFRGGLENFCPTVDSNRAASHVLQAAWLTFGLDSLTGRHKAFVNFTRDLLVEGYGQTLPVESTVIELLESIDGEADVVEACQQLKRAGYLLALDDFVYRPALDPLIALVDIVKIGFQHSDPSEQAEHVRRVASHEPKLLAEAVETQEEYEKAKALGFTYFQGYFFHRPEIVKGRALSGSRLTYLRLLQAVARPTVNIDELDSVLRTDVSITHRFMKYLGSPMFCFRGTISSVRQGLVLLGKEQTRRWISLVALGEISRDKPQEVLVSAAVRAKFCERLGIEIGLSDRGPDLFLLGALSLVDAMLDQPMSEVLGELPLVDDLKSALEGTPGTLRPVLEYVERYERGDWPACAEISRPWGIEEERVVEMYKEAVAWAAEVLSG